MTSRVSPALGQLRFGPEPRVVRDSGTASRIVECRLTSLALPGAARRALVYLPASYEREESARRRYTAVYLLGGMAGRAGDWVRPGGMPALLDGLVAQRRIPESIAVMPEVGSRAGLGSIGANGDECRRRYEDFVAHDLVKWVDQSFRTNATPEHRVVAGVGEGAVGAVHLGLRHPDLFGSCVGLSGDYRISSPRDLQILVGQRTENGRLREIHAARDDWSRVVQRLRQLRFVITCGWLDPAIAHAWALRRVFDEVGVGHTFSTYWGGRDWTRWRAGVAGALCEILSPAEALQRHAVEAVTAP